MRISCVIFIIFFVFIYCSLHAQISGEESVKEYKRNYYSQYAGFNLPENYNCNLYTIIEEWIGTPYRYAGNASSGTDCSGFVNALYSKAYSKNIGARSSADMYKTIMKSDKKGLKEGDLVFFRIRRHRVSHVGLYLGGGKFVHASVKSGVIISDLDEPYYKKYFAGGGSLKTDAIANK